MDPDGAGLKLERYLVGLPRLMKAEENGEPVHASPTALRSNGFTVVRNLQAMSVQERISRQREIATQMAGRPVPMLTTEDVTQGYRVEVWDDTAAAWFSLHERRIDATVLDQGAIVDDVPETGFIQGTTATETPDVDDSPVHIHEAMFGWEGWSLAAARPGKRVRHEDGDEIVEDQEADPDPVTPLLVRSEVEPGTLPRLRYGRSYAFRVWATDLAGNSRRHTNGPGDPPDPDLVSTIAAHLAARRPPLRPAGYLEPMLRSSAAEVVVRRRTKPTPTPRRDLPDDLIDLGVVDAVIGRIAERRGDRPDIDPVTATSRSELVARAFSDVVLDDTEPFLRETMSLDPTVIARIVGGLGDLVSDQAPVDLVSPLRPFLRWDPVQPPAIVSRGRYTEGESLRQVVVRSGVTQDPATLEITVTPPEVYGPDHAALDYGATSERHLVPPKTSQSESELHGAFDDAIGSTDPADHSRLLAIALRESGTLFDVEVRRLDDPTQFDPQPGIALLTDPDVPVAERRTLPLPPGDVPVPGQYVVHDTDQLRLPYLPDVVARGISLVFPEAGRDRSIPFPFGTEGFTAGYAGDWPECEPFRLVLGGAATLDGDLNGNTLTIRLPPGDVQKFRLSSSLAADDLDLFGLWRSLPAVITTNPDVLEAVVDGWLWAFTPFEEVTLVHAVPRPIEIPRPVALAPFRAKAATSVAFGGAVDVHGPSTESLTLAGHWIDPVDDLNLPGPEDRPQRGVAFTTRIRPDEDIALLSGGDVDTKVSVPGFGDVWVHRAVHELGDTRHRTIHYRFRATTRFEEYFAPETLTATGSSDPGDPSAVVDDGRSVVGPETTVNVLSTAIPAAPRIHSVIPLFRWNEGTEAEQPVAVRRRRRTGVRIYLERPWYSSGAGELVGVLIAKGGKDGKIQGHVSGWGSDPVWRGAPIASRGMVTLDHLMHLLGLDDRPGDATPVVAPATLPLATVGGAPEVTVLGYRPQYNADRKLWYVDIAVDPGATMSPFVQLAIARYQPDSVAGCHLSAPVLCDFVPLTPERTASVSRTDVRHVRVVVSGPVGLRTPADPRRDSTFPDANDDFADAVDANRRVIARLQRIDTKVPTDLGWQTVDVVQLDVLGRGTNEFEAAWVGTLEADRDLRLRRPGTNKRWRVTIEEWETLPGDRADLGDVSRPPKPPVWEQRLVYADELHL